jgi:FtsZ-binding cell division protein ZapB
MINNNTQTVTISVARYKQLEGLLKKARDRAWTYEQANDALAARVAELEAELSARLTVEASASLQARVAELEEDNDALERRLANVQNDRDEWQHCNAMLQDENAALKNRIAGLEKLSLYLSKKRDEKKEEVETVKARREANLKWIKNLVHSAWMLAEREGAGEEALEELVHIRDLINYTVVNMLQNDDE